MTTVFVVAYQGPVYADPECDLSYYDDNERVSEDCNDIRAVFSTLNGAERYVDTEADKWGEEICYEYTKEKLAFAIQHQKDFHWQIHECELDKSEEEE